MSVVPLDPPRRLVDLDVDGETVRVPDGATILDACRARGIDTPTLCFADTLTPVNACRVCVVDVEGSRTLVPACSRPIPVTPDPSPAAPVRVFILAPARVVPGWLQGLLRTCTRRNAQRGNPHWKARHSWCRSD